MGQGRFFEKQRAIFGMHSPVRKKGKDKKEENSNLEFLQQD